MKQKWEWEGERIELWFANGKKKEYKWSVVKFTSAHTHIRMLWNVIAIELSGKRKTICVITVCLIYRKLDLNVCGNECKEVVYIIECNPSSLAQKKSHIDWFAQLFWCSFQISCHTQITSMREKKTQFVSIVLIRKFGISFNAHCTIFVCEIRYFWRLGIFHTRSHIFTEYAMHLSIYLQIHSVYTQRVHL